MLDSAFWLSTLDRATKSFAQALLLLWGASAGFNILDVQVLAAFGFAAGAAALSLLTSIVSAGVGDKGSTTLLPGGEE